MVRKEIVAYNTDASRLVGRVEKVVFPKNVKEVSEIVRITNMDIVPRGAGSGFEGGCVPNSSLVVDMTKMNKIISFSPGKRLIVVEAGIILKELNEKLKSKGYEFPIDTLNKGISSIGGMIATNASGKRAMKYGAMRDWLDEIEFVNGKGEIIKTSKADLTDACGMEGITGIITSAKIRVLPIIKRSFSVFQSDKLEDVLHVGRRLKSEKEVCSIILLSRPISKMLGFIEKYNLIVEFDSERGKIKGEEYGKILKKLENIYYTLGINDYYRSEDPKLFFDKIKEFLEILEQDNIPYFSYLGSGVIHPFFKDHEKDKQNKVMNIIRRVQAKLGKYGYGIRRKDFLESFESKLIQRVKQRHDPSGKLNRGKLIDGFVSYVKKPEPKEDRGEKPIGKSVLIRDSFKEERLEIKPSLGEEITALQVSTNPELKSPEEKIKEFIKEVEIMEEIEKIDEPANDIENDFKNFSAMKITSPADENREKESMEEQTRLSFVEKREVESFAREIPREIVKQTTLPLRPRLISDYEVIKHTIEDKPGEKLIKKPETSQEERDLINKIMGNRFGNINKGDNENEK